ncbi:capsule assembly Wzi family protein [Roseivirga sp.]|uniref:capsule assembly Wzi family protein n=1 Tax=Roseivirga sp. TaxID=1964215 RepID=UPI003B521EAA
MVRNFNITLFLFLILGASSFAQDEKQDSSSVNQELQVEYGAFASDPSGLPFWMTSNNSGRFTNEQTGTFYSLIHYNVNKPITDWLKTGLEVEGIASVSNYRLYGSVIQANYTITTPIVKVTVGLDEEFMGLRDNLLSLGSLVYGNNARPIPKIRIESNGWLESPILSKHFSFKAYLAHGWFDKNRTFSGVFLHQKYFYGRAQFFKKKFEVVAGLNHNAMWGGTNINTESIQPGGLGNYARIFFGASGGKDALQTDQKNALGNHLGSYDINTSYRFKHFKVTNYWQFLWEDTSGLTPWNWRDGMAGLSVELNEKGIIDQFVLEVVRTNDQDAYKLPDNGIPIIEPDDFFNNSVYTSGWTYNDRVIGTPMFLSFNDPVTARNYIQNKVNAVNVGVGGHYKSASYTLRYTEFENHGRVKTPIVPSLFVKSVDLTINYQLKNQSSVGFRAVYQDSNFGTRSNLGIHLSYRRSFGL